MKGVVQVPIYEFKCSQCDHLFEKLCKMSEKDDSVKCTECGSIAKKQLSLFQSQGKGIEMDLPPNNPCGGCGDSGGCGFRQ